MVRNRNIEKLEVFFPLECRSHLITLDGLMNSSFRILHQVYDNIETFMLSC